MLKIFHRALLLLKSSLETYIFRLVVVARNERAGQHAVKMHMVDHR